LITYFLHCFVVFMLYLDCPFFCCLLLFVGAALYPDSHFVLSWFNHCYACRLNLELVRARIPLQANKCK